MFSDFTNLDKGTEFFTEEQAYVSVTVIYVNTE